MKKFLYTPQSGSKLIYSNPCDGSSIDTIGFGQKGEGSHVINYDMDKCAMIIFESASHYKFRRTFKFIVEGMEKIGARAIAWDDKGDCGIILSKRNLEAFERSVTRIAEKVFDLKWKDMEFVRKYINLANSHYLDPSDWVIEHQYYEIEDPEEFAVEMQKELESTLEPEFNTDVIVKRVDHSVRNRKIYEECELDENFVIDSLKKYVPMINHLCEFAFKNGACLAGIKEALLELASESTRIDSCNPGKFNLADYIKETMPYWVLKLRADIHRDDADRIIEEIERFVSMIGAEESYSSKRYPDYWYPGSEE